MNPDERKAEAEAIQAYGEEQHAEGVDLGRRQAAIALAEWVAKNRHASLVESVLYLERWADGDAE